ncbi:MAG: NAD(P)H-quinone oxidoreductase, partial [Alteraurantiacibacter sp.]
MAEDLPKTMSVIAISEAGGPEVLTLRSRNLPQPAKGEVLVKVSFAGVNRPDCLQRAGSYPPPENASDLPGREISGTLV